ncbi:M48 family metallopeptidase [Noviherbaspirillum sp.]|uniref:M48 family metallopeptidase n=1 Tax=Noviherbaspirillum sp. TaxID=1926288 RepID=UPI002D33621F|nr:M48 family metallopeptidase [Noviherbaspirillum sp.]HZW20027.1 M48 family metallopeptidase [Noviherbaspirillum sp.]
MGIAKNTLVALILAGACGSTLAQLPFSLPGFGNGGGGGGGFNLNNVTNLVSNLGKATKETDEPEEIRIGQEFAGTLLGAKPLVNDPALQRYVNTLGRWLAMQTERPDLPWTFGVLDDAGFNAFATPGGYIFVTKGLVQRMRSEAELAGVLAHEIGHVLKKHHLRAVQKNAGFALVGDVLNAAGKGNPEARNALLNIGKKLYASGLDKEDEFEADRLGVVIAARAGYDAYGLPSVLQMLQRQNAGDGDFGLLFRTHPAPAARIELLDRLMRDRLDNLAGAEGQVLNVRLGEFRK